MHTIELYRGLAGSTIRHVTPRHEQGAAFMADGYARASGKPGVAFVITGPGLTNTITAMGQARADSVPMLVVSGVNQIPSLGLGLGFLHELPDQRGMLEKLALASIRVHQPSDLAPAISHAFALFKRSRPGPVHIEIPLDVMGLPAARMRPLDPDDDLPEVDRDAVVAGARLLGAASRPVILAGGGAKAADAELRALAERLDAPVLLTTNARGLMHDHPLVVTASPSLKASRTLIADADAVLAVGTEFGPTDYDMYGDGGFAVPDTLVRIDIDAEQLDRRPARIRIEADSVAGLAALNEAISERALTQSRTGQARAAKAREAARAELDATMQVQIAVIETIRDTLPGSIVVGDSTQPIYAANLFYDHDRPAGWFNAATGFGALGFGPPAAIGAAIAVPDATVVCITGDGGFQFSLPELATAVEARANVIFVVWNNRGYREIRDAMLNAGVAPVGVTPAPPDFGRIAEAYGIAYAKLPVGDDSFAQALQTAKVAGKPYILELDVA